MSLSMTKAEREAFLADLHVAVVSIPEAGAAPVTAPIWYRYQPGGQIEFITDRDSRKGRQLAANFREAEWHRWPPSGVPLLRLNEP